MIYFLEHTYFVLEEGVEMTQGTTNEAITQQPKNQQKKHKQLAKEAVKSKK